jgi:hypothetical protein
MESAIYRIKIKEEGQGNVGSTILRPVQASSYLIHIYIPF